MAEEQLCADHRDAFVLFELRVDRLIEQMAVAQHRPHHAPNRGFLPRHQCHDPEVRQEPCLGHAQSEVVHSAGVRRSLQQAPHRAGRNTQVGVVQAGRIEAHIGEQGQRIEAGLARHVGVVGQAGAANEIGHGWVGGVPQG